MDYMINEHDNQKGRTYEMLVEHFGNFRPDVSDLIKSIPLSILLANYTSDRHTQLKYVEHLRNCGIPYLDAYKVCNYINGVYEHTKVFIQDDREEKAQFKVWEEATRHLRLQE